MKPETQDKRGFTPNKAGRGTRSRSQMGFSIFELIIAVFVFSFIAIVAAGAFVHGLTLQRRANNTQIAEEAARFTMEALLRDIRVADSINEPDNGCEASPPVQSITIDSTLANDTVTYIHSPADKTLTKVQAGETEQINSNAVDIIRLDFYCFGTTAQDSQQPLVTIVGTFESGTEDERATIKLQTSVSQRRLSD